MCNYTTHSIAYSVYSVFSTIVYTKWSMRFHSRHKTHHSHLDMQGKTFGRLSQAKFGTSRYFFYIFWPIIFKTSAIYFWSVQIFLAFFGFVSSWSAPNPPSFWLFHKMHFFAREGHPTVCHCISGDYEKFCGNYETSSQSEPQFILFCRGLYGYYTLY